MQQPIESNPAGHYAPSLERRVLIVDDDPVFALLASETLEQAGFATSVASNAAGAFALLEEQTPDLVLLDVELPGKSGFDICTTLRAMSSGADVPIVMVTGHEDTESIALAYLVGATDFIHKPILWPTLPHRIGFILRAMDNLRALRLSEQKNRALLQALPDTILIVSREGILLEHITGDDQRERVSLVGKRLEEVLPAQVAHASRLSLGGTGTAELVTHEFIIGHGKEQKAIEARLRPQADGTLLIVTRDTTERQRAKARIEYLAYYDTLTGLPNRQLFVRHAGRVMRAAKQAGHLMALLYLDLDRFKRINDNFGHMVGDTLLQHVGRRVKQSVRSDDAAAGTPIGRSDGQTRVARLGGDEFVVLLGGLSDEAHAVAVAHRIQASLGKPFEFDGHCLVVTPSIGIALYPRDATDVEDLLVKADMAMYRAKDQGRNGHAFYGDTMAIRSRGRLEIETDLRRAFENGDFQLHYQPKVDLATGAIIGAEALLRWRHATRGWIAPDTFIPVAEETGLIVELGDWVIVETCKQLKQWASDGRGELTIAVNVSVHQFAKHDFVDSVLRALAQFGVRPEQLELEITESLLMKSMIETTKSMKRLRAAGVALSIDDFGTGYSSLGYLRQFPVGALKIDRSFVKDLDSSSDAAAICATIIAMARELKLKVIAEGVETTEQMEFLRHHRCDQAQGYLFSAAVAAAELDQLLRAAPARDAPYALAARGASATRT
jgi:diguanylate cyclase (GGDEF)-like protein